MKSRGFNFFPDLVSVRSPFPNERFFRILHSAVRVGRQHNTHARPTAKLQMHLDSLFLSLSLPPFFSFPLLLHGLSLLALAPHPCRACVAFLLRARVSLSRNHNFFKPDDRQRVTMRMYTQRPRLSRRGRGGTADSYRSASYRVATNPRKTVQQP